MKWGLPIFILAAHYLAFSVSPSQTELTGFGDVQKPQEATQ